ncbi:MAG: InlB B-repeat-containing protein, partial [Ruminiclostridium sp.]|nr:InlB B-repeat-containing protein [Ruminiclostridium sp.]
MFSVNYTILGVQAYCPHLLGGAGTAWSEDNPTDGTYARIDRPKEGKPGYFTLRTPTVTYDANGHGTAPEEETVTWNTKATAPTGNPTATGCTFGGWYTDKACTKLWDFDTPVTEDLTLYAKWTPVPYAVTYDSSGGSAVATGSYNIETETFDLPVPTKAGYTFAGWKVTTAAEGGTGFAADDVLTGSSVTLAGAYGAVALTAQWTAKNITLTWNAEGGSAVDDTSKTYA